MDQKVKTRPSNNFNCFEGQARELWRKLAEGRSGAAFRNSPQGYYIDVPQDLDGCEVLNGGIQSPRETIIPNGAFYYRFVSTQGALKHGKDAWVGHWWLTESGFQHLAAISRETQAALATVAQNYLCLPREWSDCGHVVKAYLSVDLKAWMGHGRPAHGLISPDSAERKRFDGGLYWMPGQISPPQLFIPGDLKAHFPSYFQPVWQQRTGILDDFK